MNRKILFPIIILLVSVLGAFALIRSSENVQIKPLPAPPPLVRVQPVHLTDMQLIVSAQGTVAPRTESTLIAQVAGQIINVSPEFVNGGFFEKDDILLSIDPRDYEVTVVQAQVQVALMNTSDGSTYLPLSTSDGNNASGRLYDVTPGPYVEKKKPRLQAKNGNF